MKHLKFGALVPAVLSVLLLATGSPPAQAETTYVKQRVVKERIGMVHARAIALRQHPGKVVRWGLVRDRNGEERYVFNIRNKGGLYAVGVDADTGVVVQNFRATPARAQRSNFWDRLFAPTRIGN